MTFKLFVSPSIFLGAGPTFYFAQKAVKIKGVRQYPDFETFFCKNKSVFSFFGGKRIFRAIWESRQAEIDTLKKTLRDREGLIAWLKQQIVDLKDQVFRLESERDELKTAQKFGHLMEQAHKMSRSELKAAAKNKAELVANMQALQIALARQDEANNSLQEELHNERQRHAQSIEQLQQARARIRTQKRLNGQMGEQLLAANSQLEKFQSS